MPHELRWRTLARTVSPVPWRRCSVAPVHFVIMGCGRVGASLARGIERAGHEVAVVDQDESAFRRLGTSFEGRTVTGVGFDRDTLRAAGIDHAYAFAAVSSGDNSNILAARVAREKYGVENVVARIYDPGRAEIYQRLGIPTVATVKWTSDQMLRRLLPQGHVPEFTDPSGKVVIAEMPVSSAWVGRRMREIEDAVGGRLAYLTRLGDGLLPGADTVYQEGDLLHIALRREDLATAERVLDGAPPAH
jgi:trk system potassium uptake protein